MHHVHLINEEELNQIHELLVVFPFPRYAVPLLRGRDDNRSGFHVLYQSWISVTGKLSNLELHNTKLLVPISLTLGTKRLGWCLIHNFELPCGKAVDEATNGELENDSLSTACWRGENEVIGASVHRLEALGLHGIEVGKWEHRAEAIRQCMR